MHHVARRQRSQRRSRECRVSWDAGFRLKLELTLEDPLCLRCQRTGHIRRDCHVANCAACHRFGHDADHCVKTYATARGFGRKEANAELFMDEVEAGDTDWVASANASAAAKPVDGDRLATDPSQRPAGPPPAAASTEQKAARRTCDGETTARENKAEHKAAHKTQKPPVVHDVQNDNQVHMADTSMLATKRRCELD